MKRAMDEDAASRSVARDEADKGTHSHRFQRAVAATFSFYVRAFD